MTAFPAPTRAAHERFCVLEGWERVRDARGRTGTHHVTYTLALPDGRILRTRISHPVDRSTYGPALWGHILRDQLEVDAPTFWGCVRDGVVPTRARVPESGGGISAALVYELVVQHGVSEERLAGMTGDAMRELLARLRAGAARPPTDPDA